MFSTKFTTGLKREKRTKRIDTVAEDVKKVLQTLDQKLILMVRG